MAPRGIVPSTADSRGIDSAASAPSTTIRQSPAVPLRADAGPQQPAQRQQRRHADAEQHAAHQVQRDHPDQRHQVHEQVAVAPHLADVAEVDQPRAHVHEQTRPARRAGRHAAPRRGTRRTAGSTRRAARRTHGSGRRPRRWWSCGRSRRSPAGRRARRTTTFAVPCPTSSRLRFARGPLCSLSTATADSRLSMLAIARDHEHGERERGPVTVRAGPAPTRAAAGCPARRPGPATCRSRRQHGRAEPPRRAAPAPLRGCGQAAPHHQQSRR